MKKKAIIVSIKGFSLTDKEKLLFLEEKPWGLILFKRNIKSVDQIKFLIKKTRKLTKDKIKEEKVLSVKGRKFTIKNFYDGFARFDFKDLCNKNIEE